MDDWSKAPDELSNVDKKSENFRSRDQEHNVWVGSGSQFRRVVTVHRQWGLLPVVRHCHVLPGLCANLLPREDLCAGRVNIYLRERYQCRSGDGQSTQG